ncbi:MAG: adenylyl-sulfate kinase [Candidatus Hydrothermales bacterium]
MKKRGFCVWLTGLPCSGKTTIAKKLAEKLVERNKDVEVLDGDLIRNFLNKDLGFTREDRMENMRRVSFLSELLTRHGVNVIVALVSPYREGRQRARESIPNFIEVYVKASLEVCEKRDVKGMYKKAREGLIKNFTGIDDPYEEPLNPEVICDTEKETVNESVDKILRFLEDRGYIEKIEEVRGYTEEEEEEIKRRLEDLGYI